MKVVLIIRIVPELKVQNFVVVISCDGIRIFFFFIISYPFEDFIKSIMLSSIV